MRTFECILAVINILNFSWLVLYRKKTQKMLLISFAISAVATIIQWFTEGIRWEMTPIYIMALFPLISLAKIKVFKRTGKEEKKSLFGRIKYVFAAILSLLFIVVAVAVPSFAFPVFSFEKLTGPYKVGTVTYHWTDKSREQVHAAASGTHRELMVQVWYPADSNASGATAPYLDYPDISIKAMSENTNTPELFLTSLRHVQTNSILKADLAGNEPKYPVIVYSHGNMGWRGENTFQIEQLVSHGYIVIGIDHVGNSNVTVFPDGRIFNFYRDAGFILSNEAFDKLVDDVRTKDIKFVLDEIEKLNANDADGRFTNRLDLTRVGMLGYSLGGATAVQVLLTDDRVKAGINMDGGFFGKLRVDHGIKRPFLLMSSDPAFKTMTDEQLKQIGKTREDFEEVKEDLRKREEHAADGGNYVLTIKRTNHTSFTGSHLFSPLFPIMDGVSAPGSTHRIMNDYTIAFFDQFLKGIPSELLKTSVGDHPDYVLKRGQ